MSQILVSTGALVLAASALMMMATEATPVLFIEEQWTNFVKKYNKKYSSVADEATARNNFVENMKLVDRNSIMHSWYRPQQMTLGLTEYADMDYETFAKSFMMPKDTLASFRSKAKKDFPRSKRPTSSGAANVSAWDWRQHGAVTRIKNQKNCGSCWSFSAAAQMEGQWFLYNDTLVSLSEQELVSCSYGLLEYGCNGGVPEFGLSWLQLNADGYWTTDAAYPYTSGEGTTGKCDKDLVGKPAIAGARVGGWELVHDFDEDAMASWMVEHGPIGVCLEANRYWQQYTGGILTDCGDIGWFKTDHCVLLVGFNNTGGSVPYWIVKNSWGTNWGYDGYMYLEKGKNLCHVAEVPYSAVSKKFD